MVKIKEKTSGTVREFVDLNTGLLALTGLDSTGDKFEKPLLAAGTSRRSFKQAHDLLERNGYSLHRDEPAQMAIAPAEPEPVADKVVTAMLKKSIKVQKAKNGDVEISSSAATPELAATHQLLEALNALVKPKTEPIIDMAAIAKLIDERLAAAQLPQKQVIEVKSPGGSVEIGQQHTQFAQLLRTVGCRINAMLVGPAGWFKTSTSEAVANALKLPFYSISVGMQTTKSEFFGYMDATGRYVRTLFREAYEKGGVFLLDEMDAGNANVLTAVNQALANRVCAFPDGMVKKHEDFVVIAAANTFGRGADRMFVGRQQLDAATLDRFAVIDWGTDEAMEEAIVRDKKWLGYVRACRDNVEKYKIRHIISPRASFYGDHLLAAGMPISDVIDMLIRKGIEETEFKKITEKARY